MILGVIKYITPTGGNTLISLRFFKGYAIIQLHSFIQFNHISQYSTI